MSTNTIQYILDENGTQTGVILPIELWHEIESEKETKYLLRSSAMKNRLIESMKRKDGMTKEEVNEKIRI